MERHQNIFKDNEILALTGKVQSELREPGTALAPTRLEVLVLIDGNSTVAQVSKRSKLEADVLRASLTELIVNGFVSVHARLPDDVLDPGDFFTRTTQHADLSKVGEHVNAEADNETEFLRRKGYCVNMARRSSIKREYEEGRKPTVLIIDDDPELCHVLELYLKLEGFESRVAMNRDEILSALRHPQKPDLVLLDVVLEQGLNGFDILAKLRQYPVLKELPVIMLTAEASREAVVRGILGGADGYITKPFEIHPLVKAVKTVLGMKLDANSPDWDYSL